MSGSYTNAVNMTPDVSYVWDHFYRRQVSITDGTGTTSYSYRTAGSAGAQRVTGEIGPLISIQSVWATTEYPALMANPNVTGMIYHGVGW